MALKKTVKKTVKRKSPVSKREAIKGKMELFQKSLTEFYEDDHRAPGVLTAWLNDKRCWYAAVHRYPSVHQDRAIVTSCKSSVSLANCLTILMGQWKEIAVNKQKNNLKEFLGV